MGKELSEMTNAKSDFILKYTQKAKEEYADKYNPIKYSPPEMV